MIGYEAERLFSTLTNEADDLVPLLNLEEVEYAEERVKVVAQKLRNRRLAAKMENVTGRTPEEAALFRTRAQELTSG